MTALILKGKHSANKGQARTKLMLKFLGCDHATKNITDAQGAIALLNRKQEVAASWNFAKIMSHWKKKHSETAFVPYLNRKTIERSIEYHFGSIIKLGTGASFQQLLSAFEIVMFSMNLKHASTTKPKPKKRSQFRVSHKNIDGLYETFEHIDIRSLD